MKATMTIPGRMPSLNEYIAAMNDNRYKGNAMKRENTQTAAWFAKSMPKFSNPVRIYFFWVEKDRRRDLDNVAFAKKFILDGLVAAGVISNDTAKHVEGFTDRFFYDKENPRIIVTVSDE